MSNTRLVMIESPYAGDIEKNVAYAAACMKDSLSRGEAPFASHLLYTQPGVLDDTIPEERSQGIYAGFSWGEMSDVFVFYTDLGWSPGMIASRDRLENQGRMYEERTLGGTYD